MVLFAQTADLLIKHLVDLLLRWARFFLFVFIMSKRPVNNLLIEIFFSELFPLYFLKCSRACSKCTTMKIRILRETMKEEAAQLGRGYYQALLSKIDVLMKLQRIIIIFTGHEKAQS